MERNILVHICFDGMFYHGFQIQQNAITVQEVFQEALYTILNEAVFIKGCSRTDSGVHANMYCISFHTIHQIPVERLKSALNNFLPPSIAVLDCKEVDLEFHARYNCTSKQYIYKIWNSHTKNPFFYKRALHYRYKLDDKMLNIQAKDFIGIHDFTSFCTKDNRKMADMHRNVMSFDVTRDDDMVTMTVEADGFLYNMVRIMVGTLLKIQQGKILQNQIPDIINKKDRKYAGATAPAHGLYLNKVNYNEIT